MTDFLLQTPLLPLPCPITGVTILGKAEWLQRTGSIKDRAARFMLEDAEKRGHLVSGDTVIEATSGNLGIALAALGAQKGYRVIIVMPDSMSMERRQQLSELGAEIVLTPGSLGMAGAAEKAARLAQTKPGCFLVGQFENPANALAHYRTTGPEIWSQSGEKVDILVAGVGTGGTVTGAGRFLKEKKPHISVVAAEPAESSVLSGGKSGSHGIQGIGAGFVPKVLDIGVVDEILPITTADAFAAAKTLGAAGFPAGISAGAAYRVALILAKRPENGGKTIAAILPDGAEKYHSLGL